MVAADRTVREVVNVLLLHLSVREAHELVVALLAVKGNASFTETLARLERYLDAMRRDGVIA
jgi:hypothetical protein